MLRHCVEHHKGQNEEQRYQHARVTSKKYNQHQSTNIIFVD